jgi:hypothetical protein
VEAVNEFVTWGDLLQVWAALLLGHLCYGFLSAFVRGRRRRRRTETIRRRLHTAERQWDRLRSGRDPLA